MTTPLLEGRCLCGAVRWQCLHRPGSATACNCTACRRYGTLWGSGHEGVDVEVFGVTRSHVRGESLGFHFCPECGCMAYWRGLALGEDGRRRLGFNLRLCEPDAVADIPVQHFDGLDTWDDLPDDGCRVRNLWF